MGTIVDVKSIFSKLHHLGVIVKDVDRVAQYYESLGFGTFELLRLNVKERRIRGKPIASPNLKVRMGYAGSIRFELIQPDVGTDSIWKDFLMSRGEGASHLAFAVDDIDEVEAYLVAKGFHVTFRAR